MSAMKIINKWIKYLTQLTDWPSGHDVTARHTLGTVVPHDALASLTERAHGSLTGIGASDHHVKTTSFADMTDRAGVTKLNWTANKLLKGAGIGSNPTEIDVPSGAATASGTFTGDGTSGRAISTGFAPKLVLVRRQSATMGTWVCFSYTYTEGLGIGFVPLSSSVLTKSGSGFYVSVFGGNGIDMNTSGAIYDWVAIG